MLDGPISKLIDKGATRLGFAAYVLRLIAFTTVTIYGASHAPETLAKVAPAVKSIAQVF